MNELLLGIRIARVMAPSNLGLPLWKRAIIGSHIPGDTTLISEHLRNLLLR